MKIIMQEAVTPSATTVNIGWHSSEASCAAERKRLRPLFRNLTFNQTTYEVEQTKAGILEFLNRVASKPNNS